MPGRRWAMAVFGAWAMLVARTASAQNPTVSGEFTVEPATLVSLGFDWRIGGDENRNARVACWPIPTA